VEERTIGGGARRPVGHPELIDRVLVVAALAAIVLGGALHLAGRPGLGDATWAAGTIVVLVPLAWSVGRTLWRRRLGVDLIALVAMAAALAAGEYLAAAVVGLMLAGGNALEEAAARRAGRELTALVERAPRVAHRRVGGALEEVPVEGLGVGDLVVVRAGEVVPVDGALSTGTAVVDESALTGEPLPVSVPAGGAVRSGTVNAGAAFELRAERPAAESAYADVVRLVREAQAQRAPFLRMADRYAVVLLPVTLAIAGLAWAASGDAVRAVAVLVVATPCPLILAAPVALVSGLSRAARRGIVVKGAGVIEALGRARTVLLDKTGTLTQGTPVIERVVPLEGMDERELLRLAASLEQLSTHVTAVAVVHDRRFTGIRLAAPEDVLERPGEGIEGRVGDRRVAVGSRGYMRERALSVPRIDGQAEAGQVFVAVDGRLAGVFLMGDRLREDGRHLVERLRQSGVRRIEMATGDRREAAERVGAEAGLDAVHAGLTPEGKLELVRSLRERPGLRPLVMVGDGINDAPALALADVGIAMGAGGATVSSETADVVILVDRVDRVAEAVAIGRRSLGIARQSVLVGLGLSGGAMVLAAFGLLPPVAGALVQEGIDVAVILNALRALGDGATGRRLGAWRQWGRASTTTTELPFRAIR
jgi:heavy metal translocating P-type ATPase